MAYLDMPQIRNLQSAVARDLFLATQHAIDHLDENNFPNPVDAIKVLSAGTGTGSLFADHSIALKKLAPTEWVFPLVLPGAAVTTTSTTGLDVGGFFVFDPAKFTGGTWYLEAALMSSVSASNATLQVKNGATVLGSYATGNTTWTVGRSTALTMPTSLATLTCTLVSAASTTTASMWAARLIYVP